MTDEQKAYWDRIHGTKKREAGFYLVNWTFGERWIPAEWDGEYWWIVGSNANWKDSDFSKIGERIQITERATQ